MSLNNCNYAGIYMHIGEIGIAGSILSSTYTSTASLSNIYKYHQPRTYNDASHHSYQTFNKSD